MCQIHCTFSHLALQKVFYFGMLQKQSGRIEKAISLSKEVSWPGAVFAWMGLIFIFKQFDMLV